MEQAAALSHWKPFIKPVAAVACLSICMVYWPSFALPLALMLPLIVCPALITAGPVYALLLPLIPCAGLLLRGADSLLSLSLASFSYFSLLTWILLKRSKAPFTLTVLCQIAAILAGLGLYLWRAGVLLGGNLFTGLSRLMTQAVAASPNGDLFLYQWLQNGFISLPSVAQRSGALLLGQLVLAVPGVREELLKSMQFLLETMFWQYIPSLLVQASVTVGLFTALRATRADLKRRRLTIVLVRKDGKPCFEKPLPLPTFSGLTLSAETQHFLFFLALCSLFLPLIFQGEVASLVSSMMLAAFSTGYYLLGAAVLIFLLGRNHPGRRWLYALLAAALYLIFPMALFMLGFCDQIMHLRAAATTHHEEE